MVPDTCSAGQVKNWIQGQPLQAGMSLRSQSTQVRLPVPATNRAVQGSMLIGKVGSLTKTPGWRLSRAGHAVLSLAEPVWGAYLVVSYLPHELLYNVWPSWLWGGWKPRGEGERGWFNQQLLVPSRWHVQAQGPCG